MDESFWVVIYQLADSFLSMDSGATKVLIVDDDPADTYMLQEMLHKFGVESVHAVVTGDEATKYILGLPPFYDRQLPDLIFVDLNLVGISGFQLIAWIKAQPLFSDIPLVVFSGSTDPFDEERALLLGAKAYYRKTGETDRLTAMVENVLILD